MQRKTWYSILGVDAKPLSTEFGLLKHFMRDLKKIFDAGGSGFTFQNFDERMLREFSNYLDKRVKAVCGLAASQVGLLHFQHQKRFLKVIVSSY